MYPTLSPLLIFASTTVSLAWIYFATKVNLVVKWQIKQISFQFRLSSGSEGAWTHCRLRVGCLAPPCLLSVSHQHPVLSLLLFSWEQNYGLSIVSAPAAAFHLPFPLPFAELSPALWDLVKTKPHYRGESGLAQPTGNKQSHNCEGLLYSAPLFFFRVLII